MSQRTYNWVTATLFAIIALAHLLRAVFGWTAQIGAWTIPVWVSWPAVIIIGALAWFGFRLTARSGA